MTNHTWSFSSLNAYTTCPRQYHALKIERRYVQEETEQIRWGQEVHKSIENCVRDKKPLPERMSQFVDVIDKYSSITTGEKFVEVKFAVDRDLNAVDFNAPTAWARGITDYLVVSDTNALAIDWKTGKKKKTDQLKLMAGLVLAAYPDVVKVTTVFEWLPINERTVESFDRKDFYDIWKAFTPLVTQLEWSFAKNIWPARRSGLCKQWCPVLDCEYNGRSR